MADVLTFRAETMQQALNKVRKKLGSDAVIFHTRQVAPKKLLPWSKSKSEVEITAGTDINVRPRILQPAGKPASTKNAMPKVSITNRPELSPAARLAARTETNSVAAEFTTTESRTIPSLAQEMQHRGTVNRLQQTPVAQRSPYSQAHEIARHLPDISTAPMVRRTKNNQTESERGQSDNVTARLDKIQQMLEKLEKTQSAQRTEDIPADVFSLYTHLIDADVEEPLARQLVLHLRTRIHPEKLKDQTASLSYLRTMISSEIRCGAPITAQKGQRKVVALVGTTGVGKTTTIAKLAANLRLRDNIKMGLVTVDTYRIAAVEQLRTYADIIDLPMKVVTNSMEMRQALDELSGLDLVLIDTAGRSPRDDIQIQELKTLLSEARVDEVHLVLSMNTSLKGLESSVRLFSAANPTAVMLTKLDEATGMGSILSIARHSRLPISYLTTGQMVPDDLEVAQPERLARLILGEEHIPT